MRILVLGVEQVSYNSKKTGLPVSGIALHSAFKDPNVQGDSVDKIFISDNLGLRNLLKTVSPGTYLDVQTNFRGFVTDVVVLPENAKPKSA